MKKNYIAPLMETIEIDDVCQVGLTTSKGEDVNTPGNDTYIPDVDIDFGGDEGEDTDPA